LGGGVRPKSIVYFERLQLGSYAVAIVYAFLAGFRGAAIIEILVIAAVFIGLTLLASRRRSRVATWIIVALFAVGMPIEVKNVFRAGMGLPSFEMTLVSGMQLVGLILLFTPPARRWMRRKPDPEAEAEIFS
jgi:hypothetical protein